MLAAVGLILPAVLDIAPVLVPLAALGLALIMAGAVFSEMQGTLTRDSTSSPIRGGARMTMTGTVTGYMVLDRGRGWVTDASTEMSMRSHIAQPPGSGLQPVKMHMRLVQRQRTMDKR